MKPETNYIAYVSSFPPRECGIATFTQDLTLAFEKKFNPLIKAKILALNDQPTSIYNYSKKVFSQLTATDLEHYVRLAKKINRQDDIKVVNVQHEFGLFGGDWGDYLIPFLQTLEKPIVTTFHTVLAKPEKHLYNVVRAIANYSKAIVVMNQLSQELLERDYEIPKSKISLVPHGIPQTPFEASDKSKDQFGLKGKIVLSTFGMLSQNKGLEYAIRALPKVVQQFPNIMYVILGATHPVVRREEGEKYRNFLIQEVERLGLKNNVKFYNKYLTLEEIVQYLKATDIYISPTLDMGQSVSGTISYAMGCGRPIISTANAYAKYIIDQTNGVLVNPRNASQIGNALQTLLTDQKRLKTMGQESYERSRQMIWPNVAASYFNIYKKFTDLEAEERKLPEIKLDHLFRLTDDFGIMHHARYSKPAPRFGYSLDDNARALIIAANAYRTQPKEEVLGLLKTYITFLTRGQKPNGIFTNMVNHKREWQRSDFDEDTQGRAIWALGFATSITEIPYETRQNILKLFHRAVKPIHLIQSPRAIAFAMCGLYFYLRHSPEASLLVKFQELADAQVKTYRLAATGDWHWFEDRLTYSSSALPESLFYAYDLTKNKTYLTIAKESLNFLRKITFEKDFYSPIGQNGWYVRNEQRAYYDQQPEDAASMVQTKVTAYKITGDPTYLKGAFATFQWFLGKNHLNQMVYDEVTGGCNDGVGQYAINLNQGAESTISYLLARFIVEEVKSKEI